MPDGETDVLWVEKKCHSLLEQFRMAYRKGCLPAKVYVSPLKKMTSEEIEMFISFFSKQIGRFGLKSVQECNGDVVLELQNKRGDGL